MIKDDRQMVGKHFKTGGLGGLCLTRQQFNDLHLSSETQAIFNWN
jgi:hypothetical protein